MSCFEVGPTAAIVGCGGIGNQLDGTSIVGDSLGVPSGVGIHCAATLVTDGTLGVELDGEIESVDGLVVAPDVVLIVGSRGDCEEPAGTQFQGAV